MESQVLSIRGMTCAACAQRIERTVRKISGVGQASVNLASEKLFVEYDSSLPLDTIKNAVSDRVSDSGKTGQRKYCHPRRRHDLRGLCAEGRKSNPQA